jgi:iron complex outermembrane receptor protein
VNVPLVDGKAALRVTGSYRSSDGYIRNVGPAGDRNDFDRQGARVAFRATPTDRFTVDAAFAYQDLDQSRYNTVFDGHLIGTIAAL